MCKKKGTNRVASLSTWYCHTSVHACAVRQKLCMNFNFFASKLYFNATFHQLSEVLPSRDFEPKTNWNDNVLVAVSCGSIFFSSDWYDFSWNVIYIYFIYSHKRGIRIWTSLGQQDWTLTSNFSNNSLNSDLFFQLVRFVFPDLGTRRLGTRGSAR